MRRYRAVLSSTIAALALGYGCACDDANLPFADGGPRAPDDGATSVIALAGADLRVLEGSRVQLDGNASRSLLDDGGVVLGWSQVEGPSVVLTNPSSSSPAFVAPLSPATLRFRLRAESSDGAASFDEVTVHVLDTVGEAPFFVEVPADVAASAGEPVTFSVDVMGRVAGTPALAAEARCRGAPSVVVDGLSVVVDGLGELPCVVVVDAADAQGRRSGTAAYVIWPATTPLAPETRMSVPVVAAPGAEIPVSFAGPLGDNASTRAWPAGGKDEGLASRTEGRDLTAVAPLRRARIALGGERRRGPASGGVRYAFVDVTAGAGNRAPTASGGGDRRVRPGASFSLATSGSSDLDGDPLAVTVTQVRGTAALLDEVQPNVFHAPAAPDVLLFHVVAFDGVVYSDPDSVRVVVDPEVENQEPVLLVEPQRYVAPGRQFRVDASRAYDPDSGFIDRWSIAQDPNDPVILLPAPVEEPFVDLLAGADGDVYHFRLSAFDEEGQGAFADVEVIVEEAGPYVDATLGSDETGNGTPAAPFASLAAALIAAARHQLDELRVGAGPQLPFSGAVEGVRVVGGWRFEAGAWLESDERSRLPIGVEGVVLDDATLVRVALELTGAGSDVTLAGQSALTDVLLGEGPVHQGLLFVVAPGAAVALEDVDVVATTPTDGEAALGHVAPGAALRVVDSSLSGGPGSTRTGLECEQGTVDVIRSAIVATSGAVSAVGIDASACDIQLLESSVSGGTSTTSAIGVRVTETLLYVDPLSVITGAALGATTAATGVLVSAGDAPVLIEGTVHAVDVGAGAATAVGVDAGSSRVAVAGALVSARGVNEAIGVLARASDVQVLGASIDVLSPVGVAVGVDLLADDIAVEASMLGAVAASAFGVRAAAPGGVGAPRLEELTVDVVGVGDAIALGLSSSGAVLIDRLDVSVHVNGDATSARALELGDGVVRDSRFVVTGGGEALGVVVAVGGAGVLLERCAVVVESSGGSAVALLGGAPIDVASTFLKASSPAASVGLEARSEARLRHATVTASDTAVLGASSQAVVDIANSLLVGQTGFERTTAAPPPSLAATIAISADRPWVDGDGQVAASADELAAAGCQSCFAVGGALVDDTGHLIASEDHPLVDAADPALSTTTDIDGEPRPSGPLPDIGCDELPVP